MNDVGGIPTHPLLVHGVVVLAPLAAVLVIAAALSARVRARAGIVMPLLATLVLVLTPLTAESGEGLEHRVQQTTQLHEHTELGDTFIIFAVVLAGLAWAVWWLGRSSRAADGSARPGTSTLFKVAAGLAVIASIAATGQIVRIGHSGAVSVWSDTPAASQGAGGDGDSD